MSEDLSESLPVEIEAIVEAIESEDDAQAVADVLDGDIDEEDIAALGEVNLDELPDEAVEAIVEVLNEAPDDIKQELEAEINVFSGTLDTYIPSGSNVTVAERRTIVAVTATIASPVSPLPGIRRRKA